MSLSRLLRAPLRRGAEAALAGGEVATAPGRTRLRSEGRLLQASLLAGGALTVMSNTSLAPALPKLQAAFAEAGELQIRLILTIPALVIVVASPLAGWLADRYGRKPLLTLSALLFGLAGTSGYLAQDILVLLAGRALLGVAVAGVMTCLAALIVDYYSGPARAHFLGLQSAVAGVGGSFFLILGGALAETGWRQPFLMYLAALILLPFLIHNLYEPARPARTVARSVGAAKVPILRLMLLVYGLVGASQAVFNLVPLQLPFLMQMRFNTTATQSGFAISLVALFFALAALVYGRMSTRVAHVPLAGVALAVLGGSYLMIALASTPAAVYAAMMLAGLGLGLLLPNLNLWLANHTPQALRGRVLGGFSASLFLGQFLSPILFQASAGSAATGTLWLNVGVGVVLLGALVVALRGRLARVL